MIAYKFLSEQGVGRFSRQRWPLPAGDEPGAWLHADGALSPCHSGLHACSAEQLPHWLDLTLWQVELAGQIVSSASMVVAERGRLLRRVDGWNDAARAELCGLCIARAADFLAELERRDDAQLERGRIWAAQVSDFARSGEFATAAYVSAVLAHLVSEQDADAAYAAERRIQGDWLARRLALV